MKIDLWGEGAFYGSKSKANWESLWSRQLEIISEIDKDLPLVIIMSDGAAEIEETPDDSMLDQARIRVECQVFPLDDLLSLKSV